MTTTVSLKKILDTFLEHGFDDDIAASHDQIFLAGPNRPEPDSPCGKALQELGCSHSEAEGWYKFV